MPTCARSEPTELIAAVRCGAGGPMWASVPTGSAPTGAQRRITIVQRPESIWFLSGPGGSARGVAPCAVSNRGSGGGRNRNLPPGRFFRPFLDGTRNGPAGGNKGHGHGRSGRMPTCARRETNGIDCSGSMRPAARGLAALRRRNNICDHSVFIKIGGAAEAAPPGVYLWVFRGSFAYFPPMARYRKVTIWPLVQVSFGANVVSIMPFVTPSSTAQATALA